MTAYRTYIRSKKQSSIDIKSVQNTMTFYRIVIFAYTLYFLDVQDISYNVKGKYLLHSKYSFSVTLIT